MTAVLNPGWVIFIICSEDFFKIFSTTLEHLNDYWIERYANGVNYIASVVSTGC